MDRLVRALGDKIPLNKLPGMTDETKTWWADSIKSLGFPIVMCVALMWGCYQIFVVFVTPLFNKQIETLEVVTQTQGKMAEKLGELTASTANNKVLLDQLIKSDADELATLKKIEQNTQYHP